MGASHLESEKLLREFGTTGSEEVTVSKPKRQRSLKAVVGAALFVAGLVQLCLHSTWDDWSSVIAEPSGGLCDSRIKFLHLTVCRPRSPCPKCCGQLGRRDML